MKTILLITHAETDVGSPAGWKPNPSMTDQGYRRVQALRPRLMELLPGSQPSQIHCGMGARHHQVVAALDFSPQEVFFSDVWGGAATLVVDGGEKRFLIPYHGDGAMLLPPERYLSTEHLRAAAQDAIRTLPDHALICSGRPVLARLGVPPEVAKNGALYAISVCDDESLEIHLEVDGVNLMAEAKA